MKDSQMSHWPNATGGSSIERLRLNRAVSRRLARSSDVDRSRESWLAGKNSLSGEGESRVVCLQSLRIGKAKEWVANFHFGLGEFPIVRQTLHRQWRDTVRWSIRSKPSSFWRRSTSRASMTCVAKLDAWAGEAIAAHNRTARIGVFMRFATGCVDTAKSKSVKNRICLDPDAATERRLVSMHRLTQSRRTTAMISVIIAALVLTPLQMVHWCGCHGSVADLSVPETPATSETAPACGCHHCDDPVPDRGQTTIVGGGIDFGQLVEPCCCDQFDQRPETLPARAVLNDGVAVHAAVADRSVAWLPLVRRTASISPPQWRDDHSLQTCRRLSRWLI